MLNYQFTLLVVALILFGGSQLECKQANANEPISFPNQGQPCSCAASTCNCCQSVGVSALKMEKNVCLQYTLKTQPLLKLDVKISMDSKTVAEFAVDPNNPPSYCIPIPLPAAVAMCVRLHDIKQIGMTAVQVCSSFYVNFKTDRIFGYELPCVQLSDSGIDVKGK